MLHPKSNGSEWILDFVRDLTRHLAPCKNTLGACNLDAAQFQIARKNSRG